MGISREGQSHASRNRLTLEIQACRLSEGTCTVQMSADKPVCQVLQTCQVCQPKFDELPEVQSEEERRESEERGREGGREGGKEGKMERERDGGIESAHMSVENRQRTL